MILRAIVRQHRPQNLRGFRLTRSVCGAMGAGLRPFA